MRIAIIGYSGSGKSTTANSLSAIYNIPKLHMDTLRFLPNWVERANDDMKELVADFLSSHDSWVMDGNYSFAYYAERMEMADQIIWMNFNRFNCLYRVIKRYLTYRGKNRESAAPGCREKLDLDFIWWVLFYGRRKQAQDRYRDLCQTYPEKMVILKTQKDIDNFFDQLKR